MAVPYQDSPRERDEKATVLANQRDKKAAILEDERDDKAEVLAEAKAIKDEDVAYELREIRVRLLTLEGGVTRKLTALIAAVGALVVIAAVVLIAIAI